MRWLGHGTVHEEGAIKRARNLLKEKPSRIFAPVSQPVGGVLRGGNTLIRAASTILSSAISGISQIELDKTTKEVLLGIITIALAIVSFGGATFGLLAAGAAFGISTVQAVGAIEEV